MDLFEEISDTAAVTSFDPNESLASATLLDAGTYEIQGNNVDWYRFDVSAGEMSFTMTQDSNLRDLSMILYNEAGQAIARDNQASATETVSRMVTADGTYYLRIFDTQFGDALQPDLQMSYTLEAALPDAADVDGNETQATARTLTEGSHAIEGSAVDWFRISSLSGRITVDLTTDAGASPDNLNVVLYDAQGRVVAAPADTSTGRETLTYNAPADGDYFIKVFWPGAPNTTSGGITLDYTLDIDLPEEEIRDANNPGETLETATPLSAGTQDVRGSGLDWFQILTGPGEMNFAMTSTGIDSDTSVATLNMTLFDADGNAVKGQTRDGDTGRISFVARKTGAYYLKVFAPAYPDGTPNGVAMTYQLETDLPVNSWSRELDFGPVRTASISAYDIDNDGRDEIFVGTSKTLDDAGNEIRPAGLIVLEDDGTVKWTKTFAAIDGPDSRSGKIYNTTSVSTQAVFSDVNGDNKIDIVIGVGGDNHAGEFNVPGQPGDKGGVYALDANGNELWFFETRDVFGSESAVGEGGPDGRPEGIYGTPRIFDIDADGKREVMFTSWDHRFYAVDGATGALEMEFNLHDTTSTSPGIADLDGDGLYELVIPADITDNGNAGITDQGGILHVLSNYAQANIDGWSDQVHNSTSAEFRGKFSDQPLWSSPKIADIDRDGSLEIVLGTSNFFLDERGQHIKVWGADGTLEHTLETNGQPLAAPLLADLDGNGTLEIVAATIKGSVYAWNANGQLIFEAEPTIFADPPLTGTARELPIARQPVAVDIDNADGDLEIIINMGSQIVVLDSDGTQLSSLTQADYVFNNYGGAPVVRDIDGDGRIDIVSGGTNEDHDQAIIYRWENLVDTVAGEYRTAAYQNDQSLHDVEDFVERFYQTILGRTSDATGRNGWVDTLSTGVLAGENIARGFINSPEFQGRNTSDAEYVDTLYAAFFDRPADTGGFNLWMQRLAGGADRAEVLEGFTGSREFKNLSESFGIRPEMSYGKTSAEAVITGDATDSSLLRGDAGHQILSDEGSTVSDPESRSEILQAGQVFRLYGATLGRIPDADGFLNSLNALLDRPLLDIEGLSGAFVSSAEFQRVYGSLTNGQFVDLLYQNVLGRDADAAGRASWVERLDDGASRAAVVLGFSNSGEYRLRTDPVLDAFMRTTRVEWNDVIEGGAGDDEMNGGLGSDLFVFRRGQGGNDIIHGFEPWDQLQLSGFGFGSGADARARMTQTGADVTFNHAGQTITFKDSTLADIARARFNV